MPKQISVTVKSGSITELPVDVIVNSANSLLILGSGTAGQVKQAGGYLTPGSVEYREYQELMGKAKEPLASVLRYIGEKEQAPSKVQKECLEVMIRRDSKGLELGQAVLTSSGNLIERLIAPRYIAHAVAMSYGYEIQPNPPVVPATYASVFAAMVNSFALAAEVGAESVAVPVMCTRKGGLGSELSTQATKDAIRALQWMDSQVSRIYISLYSEELQKDEAWFRSAYNNL